MARDLAVSLCSLFVQSDRTNLLTSAAAQLDATFTINSATFKHREYNASSGEEHTREAFLHAKVYAVQSGDEVIVFAGSANCSRAALTVSGADGNAELMAWTV
jgi:hypothetical protein